MYKEKDQTRRRIIKILGTINFFSHDSDEINRERDLTAVRNNKTNNRISFLDGLLGIK